MSLLLIQSTLMCGLDSDPASLSARITNPPDHGSLVANADGTWSYTPDVTTVESEIDDEASGFLYGYAGVVGFRRVIGWCDLELVSDGGGI
jgi:Bacterial Ig domain